MRRRLIALAASMPWLGILTSTDAVADRNSLWQVVGNLCVHDQERTGIPFPCQSVDLERGFAVVRVTGLHFLVVPTEKVAGIESAELLVAGAPNYWGDAWDTRSALNDAAGVEVPRIDVGLALNSAEARTQDQLHIHVGCIRPDVRAALEIDEAKTGEGWSPLPFSIGGQLYRVLKLKADTLAVTNPFRLLATGLPEAQSDMASETLVVAGAKFRDGTNGFYLLARRSRAGNPATGEELLDYNCSVLLSR